MALFTWSNDYSVGVKALDSQHTNLFNILNDLHEAMKTGQGQSVSGSLLRKLLDYTRSHFAAEEKLMEAAKYPGLAKQRIQHAGFTRKVEEFLTRLEKGERAINVDLLVFLRDWLKDHILREDKAYGPYLKEHGAA